MGRAGRQTIIKEMAVDLNLLEDKAFGKIRKKAGEKR